MSKYFRWAGLAGVVVFVVAIGILVLGKVPVIERVGDVQKWMAAKGAGGAALYPIFYAACNVLLLPAGILSIGGGFFFGLWWGFALVLTGNVLGAAIAFQISRALGRKWFERRMLSKPRWATLDAAIAREGWKIIILSQVHPLFPTSLINYLYGITSIRFWPCMLWVMSGQAPGLFLYVYLGTLAQLGVRWLAGQTDPEFMEYVQWGGGLLLTIFVTVGLGRIALKLLRECEAQASEERKES